MEAPGSIFEAPKLDLEGFWNDFFEILGLNAKKAKNAKNACQAKTSITNVPRVGGRRCSPPGGVSIKSAASARMARRVGLFCTSLYPLGSSFAGGLVRSAGLSFLGSKIALFSIFSIFFRFFGLPNNALKFASKK